MIRQRAAPPNLDGAPIPGDVDGRVEADALRIGGRYSPGWAVVSKAGIPFSWDKRKGYGFTGAWLVYTGDDLAEFDVSFTFFRQDQIDEWNLFEKDFLRKPPFQPQQNSVFLPLVPRPKALSVFNPILAQLSITQIVPKNIGQFNQVSFGKWQKVVSFYQFRKPVPFLGKPNAAIPNTAQKSPTATDAQELENRSKRQHIEALQAAIAKGHH